MTMENMIKFCPFCGSKVIPNAKFCIECGKQLIINQNVNENLDNKEDIKTNDSAEDKTNESLDNNLEEVETIEVTKNDQNIELIHNSEEPTEVKKSFSLLNQSHKNHEKNNFDLVRPDSPKNQIKVDQSENNSIQQTNPQNIQKEEISELNTNSLPCPSCEKRMHLSQTNGFLSKTTYHYCPNCNLKFKDNGNNFLTLEEEPEFSRMKNRLHLKKYTWNEWNQVLHGGHSPNYTVEFSKWQFESVTSFSCPLCNHKIAKYKSSGFSSSHYLICSGCGLTLEEHKNNQYTLFDCMDNLSPLWKYEKNLLTLDDIKNIIHTEESEETRLLRQKRVNEHDIKFRQLQLEEKRKQNDLIIFAQSLESGKPLLPVPSDTTIVLKKNEVPVYKMYDVGLSEPRAVRTSSGSYGGSSIRVAKGVTIHSGRTDSKSESHDEIQLIDQGDLLITNKRIIFLGSNRTTNIDLNKLISITSSDSSIQIQRSNKPKPEYFSNIQANETIQIDGRQHTVVVDGEMLKKLIMGLVE